MDCSAVLRLRLVELHLSARRFCRSSAWRLSAHDPARFIGPIVLWSVTFWFSFELLNIRFQNWYYIGVFDVRTSPEVILGVVVFDVACFGTVFTGLFQTYEAITALGLFRGRSIRPRRLASAASYAIQGLGAVMVALAVLFPFYLAPWCGGA